jgi:hypothetical protein
MARQAASTDLSTACIGTAAFDRGVFGSSTWEADQLGVNSTQPAHRNSLRNLTKPEEVIQVMTPAVG